MCIPVVTGMQCSYVHTCSNTTHQNTWLQRRADIKWHITTLGFSVNNNFPFKQLFPMYTYLSGFSVKRAGINNGVNNNFPFKQSFPVYTYQASAWSEQGSTPVPQALCTPFTPTRACAGPLNPRTFWVTILYVVHYFLRCTRAQANTDTFFILFFMGTLYTNACKQTTCTCL